MEYEKKEKIGLFEKLGFLSFATSSQTLLTFKSTYYKYFLTSILLINPIAASNIIILGTIWDVVNDPLLGVWANNIKFKSGEKVRPWLLYTAIPFAVGVVLIFTDFHVPEKWNIILALVVFFFYEIFNTFRGIPYNGMAALVSQDYSDRKSINAFRSFGSSLGSGLGTVAIPIIIKAFGGLRDHKVINSSDSTAMLYTAILLGCIIAFGCLFHYFTCKERVPQTSENEEKIGIVETYKMLFKCKSWVKNMLYTMFYGVSSSLMASSITYYCAYVLNDSSKSAPVMGLYLLFSMIFAILCPKIESLLGRKKTMALAAIILVLGRIPFILNPRNIAAFMLTGVTSGMSMAMSFVMFSTNRNVISDIVELQNGRRLDTIVSTGDTLANKIATAVVDKITLVVLAAVGFNAALADQGLFQNLATQNAIIALLGIVPAVLGLCMLFVVLTIDTQKEYDEALANAEASGK